MLLHHVEGIGVAPTASCEQQSTSLFLSSTSAPLARSVSAIITESDSTREVLSTARTCEGNAGCSICAYVVCVCVCVCVVVVCVVVCVCVWGGRQSYSTL